MFKLDIKDRKALYYLSQDGRMPDRQLAKRIGLSKNSVRYRIERLKKEGIITNFTCTVKLGAIGLDTFCLMLNFKDDIYDNNEILDYFKKHEFSNWAMTLSGDWDIFAEFVYKDLPDARNIIAGIVERFGERILAYDVFFSYEPLKVEHLVADIYKDLKLEEPLQKKRTENKVSIDDQDRILLNLVAKDSSLSYVTLAKKSEMSMDSVRYRIRQLQNSGVIIKFFPEVSLRKLGYTEYLFRLKLAEMSGEKAKKLKSFIKTDTNITYAFFDLISSSLIFICAFKSTDEVDHLARSIRKNYSDIIDEQTYLLVKEQLLFNLFPDGLVKPNK
jgi:DNA-binding Lrp family transcriptional regulator